MPDSYDVTITPCDPLNPGFGYAIKIEKNGVRILYTASDPRTGNSLDYASCVKLAGQYGPKRTTSG